MTTSAKFNILNALTLIVIGGMGYFATESLTALIPPAFGVILLGCHWGVEKQNSLTSTSCMIGKLRESNATRSEFLSIINRDKV